jgi:hypothetical protein
MLGIGRRIKSWVRGSPPPDEQRPGKAERRWARQEVWAARKWPRGAAIPAPQDAGVEALPEGSAENLPGFLVNTTSGLILFRNGKFRRLFDGPGYGVVPETTGTCLAVQTDRDDEGRKLDRIVRVDYASGRATVLIPFVRYMVHQIDLMDDRLVVIECYQNAVKIFNTDGELLESHYPAGRLSRELGPGGKAVNYKHFNSVFADGGRILLFAHNKSMSAHREVLITGRTSEIYVLDSRWRTREILPLKAINGHNVAIIDGAMYHCDSFHGHALVVDDQVVFADRDLYVRGLAVNDEIVLVGGSKLGEREVREEGDGHVFALRRDFSALGSFRLRGVGQIYDLRLLENDRGTSNRGQLRDADRSMSSGSTPANSFSA